MITTSGDITIRKMNDEKTDYELMTKWLSDDNILMYYQGRDNPSDISQIIKKYSPRTRGESRVVPCIIQYFEKAIGYIQYYPVDNDEKKEYGYESSELIYGIDIFIGEIEYQNSGLGERVIKSLIDYIWNNIKPEKIVIDPRIDNKRAIRCYEKCGFVPKRILPRHELHEGVYCDNLLMEIIQKTEK